MSRYCECGRQITRGRSCWRCRERVRQKLARPAELPAGCWDSDAFRDAVAEQHIGGVLRAYRLHPHHGRPLSQERVGSWLGMSQGQVSGLENGPPVRDLDKLEFIARTLGLPLDRLWFDVRGEVPRPRPSSSAVDDVAHRDIRYSDGVGVAPAFAARPAGVSAYSGLQPDGQGSVDDGSEGLIVMAGAEEAAAFLARAQGTDSGPEAVTLLHNEVRRLARDVPVVGAGTLASNLVTAQRFAFRQLDGPSDPSRDRDLYFLACITCGMLAHAALDLGKINAGFDYARTALLCADRAGHPGLRVWSRVTQSSIARWAGWHGDSLRYTQLAAEDAQSVTGSVAARRALQEARGHAMIGGREAVRGALARAAEVQDRERPDDLDAFGGFLTSAPALQLNLTADTLSWLPDYAEAERAAAEAVAAFESTPDGNFGDEATARVDLALARVRQGETEGAQEALAPVLAFPPEKRIHGVLVNLQRVHGALADERHQGSPVARDIAGEIEAFAQLPSITGLPE